MAEPRPDCTELSAAIAESAFVIADNQTNPTLQSVTNELQSVLKKDGVDIPINREIVTDAILDFTFEQRQRQKDVLLKGSSAVKQEAVENEQLVKQIERLDRDIQRGFFDTATKKQIKRRVDDETGRLRKFRGVKAQEEKIFNNLNKQTEAFLRMLSTGNLAPPPKRATRPDTRATSRLRTEKESVQAEVNRRRRAQRREKGLNEQIADLEQQDRTGQFKDRTPRQRKEISERIQKLVDRRDFLNQKIRLRKAIDKFTNQLKGVEPITLPQPKQRSIPDPEIINLQARKHILSSEVDQRIRNMKPISGLELLGEIGNSSRILLTIADLSGTLRQGGKLVMANPSLLVRNFGPMLRAMTDPTFAAEVDVAIRTGPNAWMYDIGKMHLSDPQGTMTTGEEFFVSKRDFVGRVPGLGSVKRGSERAFVTFLNLIRAQSFDRIARATRNSSPTVDEMRAIGNAINILSGRGDLGKFGNAAAPLLNQFLFATRYVASQFQTLFFNPIRKATPGVVRRQIIGVYARMLASFGLLAVLADMAGFDIEYDPRSSDFLKFRKDKTRIDMGTGLLQPIVLLTRIGKGESKSPTTGRISQLRGEDQTFGTSGFETLSRFGRSKLSPAAGMAIDLLVDGKNVVGDPVAVNSVDGIVNLTHNQLLPISVQEIWEILKEEEDLDDAAIFSLLSILGAGVATFDKKTPAPQRR